MKYPYVEADPECDPYFEMPEGYTGRWAVHMLAGQPGSEFYALDLLREVNGKLYWLLTFRGASADECLENAGTWMDNRSGGTYIKM